MGHVLGIRSSRDMRDPVYHYPCRVCSSAHPPSPTPHRDVQVWSMDGDPEEKQALEVARGKKT